MPETKKNKVSKSCYHCKKSVMEPHYCILCNTPYHPACAAQSGNTPNGGIKKCCGSRPVSPLVPLNPRASSTNFIPSDDVILSDDEDDRPITKRDLLNAINHICGTLKTDFQSAQDKLEASFRQIKESNKKLEVKLESAIQDMSTKINDTIALATDTKKTVESVVSRVDILEQRSDHPVPYVTETIFHEARERLWRANNVILFNVPENINTAQDHAAVEKIIDKTECAGSVSKVLRLGKNIIENKPRPLKVTLSSSDKAQWLLKHKEFLASVNVTITDDKTPNQREYISNLREELDSRIKNGETNLTIRYNHGIPQIVSKTPKNG